MILVKLISPLSTIFLRTGKTLHKLHTCIRIPLGFSGIDNGRFLASRIGHQVSVVVLMSISVIEESTLNMGMGVIFMVDETVAKVLRDLKGDCFIRRAVEAIKFDVKNVVRG